MSLSLRKLFIKFVYNYPLKVLLSILMGFSGGLFNGVSTALIVPIVLQLLGQEIALKGSPPILKAIFSPFDGISENYRLLVMLGAVVLTIVLKNLTTYVSNLTSFSLQRNLTNDLREEALKVLLDTDIDFYSKSQAGDLSNRLNGDISRAATAVTSVISLLIVAITILIFIGFLISLSWQLTLISTVLLTLVALVNQYSIGRSKIFGNQITLLTKAYMVRVLEVFGGIRLVKGTANEEQEYYRLKGLMRSLEKAQYQSQMNSAAIGPVSEVAGIISIIGISIFGRLVFANQLEALSTVLLTYLVALFRLLPFVSQINSVRTKIANTSASVEVAFDLLSRNNKSFIVNGSLPFTGIQEGIHFNKMSFSYPEHTNLVLKEVDLYLPHGQTLALVGASGAGKSTFADLLPRFYDPTFGSITIDGIDLRQFDFRSLRKVMGIVSQNTFLFNDTIRNNIIYARPDATEDEIIQATKQANAYEFIVRLPRGWDTQVGDRGVMLSGGQRQRLAIARALLQDPEILILDEATSALDTVSERLVQEALEKLSCDRTTLVIAHRLSTIQNADQIAVLDQGCVVETGTHEELLAQNGYYSRLYSMQFTEGYQAVASPKVPDEALIKASHEARTYLNSMLGSLRLLADEVVDSPEEKIELTEEAYHSAVNLFRTLEIFENKIK